MLYYIHGYESNPDSAKGVLFRDKLGAKPIKYRDCKPEDIVISDCLKRINNEIKDDKKVFLIGSSLGGFLAACIALENHNVKKLILLNPAVIPPSEDVSKFQGVPHRILCEMKDNQLFEKRINAEITILVGMEDDVIPLRWIMEFAIKQNATIQFLSDDHGFTKKLNELPLIISDILKS
ncbi:MAG: YqiA/YcfP family alpha/beta fold hydrolase [Candidatus Thermoplasmatota archaeon]|jgi:predicted esterase YcpF (UPF0227 family)|nr:YqiA/YcfP family alpha/beta fold hydrolase [Candidatus Thermoplasmatota archaeon]